MNHPLDSVKRLLIQIQGSAKVDSYSAELAKQALVELTGLVQEISFSSTIKKGEEMDCLPRHRRAISHAIADKLLAGAELEEVQGYGQFNFTTRVYRIYTLKAAQ